MPDLKGINIDHHFFQLHCFFLFFDSHVFLSRKGVSSSTKKERETITAASDNQRICLDWIDGVAPGGWRRSPSTWPAEIPALPPVDQPLHFFSDWMSVLLTLVTGSGLVMAVINKEDDHSSRCSPEDY